jgi:lipopolysaccharide transport system ATP-binding protein
MSSDGAKTADAAIRADAVSKSYHLYRTPRDRLKQLVLGRRRRYYEDFAALRDVSFRVDRGETVGIIGRNGSGKSTLLQIVCGTLAPTHGSVATSGRIAAMLELGAGFDPEFTGRENVYLNGELLGLSRAQVDARYASISEFADIGEFIEHPVKTYSSGMQVRLAFAVMAHVDADILVIDEALAVGDALFTQKCMRFLRAFKSRGTLLFVTHDTTAVMSLCDRAIWLDRGQIREDGAAKPVCDAYLQFLFESVQGESPQKRLVEAPATMGSSGGSKSAMPSSADSDVITSIVPAKDPRQPLIDASADRNAIRIFEFDPSVTSFGRGGASIVDVRFEDAGGTRLAYASGGETVTVAVVIEAKQPIDKPIVGFLVRDRLGQNLFGDNTYLTTRTTPLALAAGERAEARFSFDLPLLPPGDYSINTAIAEGTQEQHIQHEWINDALLFRVETGSVRHSLVGIPMRAVELKRL